MARLEDLLSSAEKRHGRCGVTMHRYFFVIKNGSIEGNDQDGTPLQDDEGARNYANRIVRELKEGGSYDEGNWTLIVFADGGRQVCSVRFATVSVSQSGAQSVLAAP
jgi:hypothetical protein